jgi:hypothetical protein
MAVEPHTTGRDVAKVVAAAFARGEPLDGLLAGAGTLPTKAVERALRHYLARELRRIARLHGQRPQDLCDVTDRTLQQWIKENGDARKAKAD